jgi:hypothetical protein
VYRPEGASFPAAAVLEKSRNRNIGGFDQYQLAQDVDRHLIAEPSAPPRIGQLSGIIVIVAEEQRAEDASFVYFPTSDATGKIASNHDPEAIACLEFSYAGAGILVAFRGRM